jgi:hypothetical protein
MTYDPKYGHIATIHPAEFVGMLPYEDDTIKIGDLVIRHVYGYNPAGVYMRRISGKRRLDGKKPHKISVAEIIISVVGDGLAQEELDAQNAEAEVSPYGPKEYWRSKMVGQYTYGADGHVMTNEDFEEDWYDDE